LEVIKKIQFNSLETKLGYNFKDKKLLEKALTHTSYYNKKEKNNVNYFQRLEFLGDSVLNIVISEYLFKKFPFFSEGELSKLKSVFCSQAFLVKFADYLMLKNYIILGKSVNLIGGRGKFSILADCIEACIGALYLDGGLNQCKENIINFIKTEENTLFNNRIITDYKTMLQELTQKNSKTLPKYEIMKEEGLEHQKKFIVEVLVNKKVYGKGIGNNKKEAEQNAAKKALKKIKSNKKDI